MALNFFRRHTGPLALLGGAAIAIFSAGGYFWTLKLELAMERELREKELAMERERREKDLTMERELREKDLTMERELRVKDLTMERELRVKDVAIAEGKVAVCIKLLCIMVNGLVDTPVRYAYEC